MSCKYCRDDMPITPGIIFCEEARHTEPTLIIERAVNVDTGKRVAQAVLYDEQLGNDMAVFKVNFCPMCGRDLGEDE